VFFFFAWWRWYSEENEFNQMKDVVVNDFLTGSENAWLERFSARSFSGSYEFIVFLWSYFYFSPGCWTLPRWHFECFICLEEKQTLMLYYLIFAV